MKKFIILIIFLAVFACQTDKGSRLETLAGKTFKVEEHFVSKGETLDPENWNCIKIQEDILCLPNDWLQVETNTFQYFGYLIRNDSNSFFVSIKYPIANIQLTLNDYLKEVYKQLKNDTLELFVDYKLNRLQYESHEVYYAEYSTNIKNRNYETMSMYCSKEGYIYDFSLKCEKGLKDEYYRKFQNVLLNYWHDGERLFEAEKKLQDVSFLSFDELK